MEWVETTGKTVEEAKDKALDQLGVVSRRRTAAGGDSHVRSDPNGIQFSRSMYFVEVGKRLSSFFFWQTG